MASIANPTTKLLSSPTRLLLAVAAVLGLSSVGCGPLTPVSPTWKDDVRPLLVSRCIRCHSDPFRTDPSVKPPLPEVPATVTLYNFDFENFTDIPPVNLLTLKLVGQYTRQKGPLFMPPAPAEALDDWQIDILDGWAAAPR